MHRVDAQADGHRRQHRGQDQDRREGLHEQAHHQQRDVDQQQEHQRVVGHAQQQRGHLLRRLVERQHIGEHRREAHDQQDDAGGHRRRPEDLGQVLPLDFAVDEHADHEGIGHRHDRGLGGGEQPAVDAAQDDHRHQQRQAGPAQRAPDVERPFAHAHALRTAVIAQARHDENGDDQRQADQQAGQDAGHEHLRHRRAGQHGVDDHRHRRRQDHAQLAAGGHHRRGERTRIAAPLHLGNHHRADGRGGGRGRAADSREEHGGQHRGAAQAALDPADQRQAQVHQPPGDAAGLHQAPGQHEERHGHQRERVHRLEHGLGHGQQRHVARQQRRQRRDAQAQGHGDAGGEQQQQQNNG